MEARSADGNLEAGPVPATLMSEEVGPNTRGWADSHPQVGGGTCVYRALSPEAMQLQLNTPTKYSS